MEYRCQQQEEPHKTNFWGLHSTLLKAVWVIERQERENNCYNLNDKKIQHTEVYGTQGRLS